jgi:hypothetical protein
MVANLQTQVDEKDKQLAELNTKVTNLNLPLNNSIQRFNTDC